MPFALTRAVQMARWNDDGSLAATARVRSGKGEPFTLPLPPQAIAEDLAKIEENMKLIYGRK